MPTAEEKYASLEVIACSYKLFLSRFWLLPFKWKRGLYKSYVNKLSNQAFEMYGGQVAESICFNKKESQRFRNSQEELKNILDRMPRLEKFRGILREHIREHRLKKKLKA